MKRIVALSLVMILALALCACGSRNQQPEAQNEEVQSGVFEGADPTLVTPETPAVVVTPTVVVTPFPAPSSTPEPTPVVAPTPTVAPTPAPDGFAAPTATATEQEKQNGYTAYVQGSGINVRAEAGSGDTPIIDQVNIGDKVLVIGEESGWTKVIFHNKVGYIYSPFIDTAYPIVNNTAPANTTTGNDASVTIIDPNGNASVVGGDDGSSGTGVIIMG